jgi:hypothetical protein
VLPLLQLLPSRKELVNDQTIRRKLRSSLATQGRLVEEWNIGASRIDMAVITPTVLHGFEIKSDVDTLKRLPQQAHDYGTVCDVCTLVAAPKHCQQALVPGWWGLTTAQEIDGQVVLEVFRPAGINPEVSVRSLAQLLWCKELRALLRERGEIGIRRKSRLVQAVVERIPLGEFRRKMLLILLNRGLGWKP